jgi:small-conductance mechanosensitive channel
MDWSSFFDHTLVRVALTLIVAYFLQRIGHGVVGRAVDHLVKPGPGETKSDEQKRENTVRGVFRTVASLIIWIVTVFVILGELKINVAAFLTGAGVLGLIAGLGAQNAIKDYIAGLFILLENQYRVGDIITLSGGTTGTGSSGMVEEITMRITRLRDLEGIQHIVRNGEASIVSNRTFRSASVVIDINVAYDSDINAVESVMNLIGRHMTEDQHWQRQVTEPIKFLRVDAFTDSAVVVRAMGSVKPGAQWDAAGEYRRRLLPALANAGVAIGLPQMIVHEPHKRGEQSK